MAIVTISEAARLAGKDRRTVQRHVSKGKLSKVTRAGRSVGVDTSELVRVYGDLAAAPAVVRRRLWPWRRRASSAAGATV